MPLRRRTRAVPATVPATVLLTVMVTVMATGIAACGSTDDGADPADTAAASNTATVPSMPPPTATSTTLAEEPLATTGIATTDVPATTTEASSDLVPVTIEIPGGSLEFGPDDVIVAEQTGDLAVYRSLLAGVSDRRELLADYPDPTGPVTEGPGPNVVDDVAGVVDGTLIFGDCCEPISGNVLIATGDPAAVRPVSPGYGPTLSPDGTQLVSASSLAIQRSSTADGSGAARLLDQGERTDGFLNVDDIAWADDDRLALLGWDDAGYALFPVDVETLTIGEPARFEVGAEEIGRAAVRFAGRAPGGELVVTVFGADSTDVRSFRTSDLGEDETMAGERSPAVTAMQRTPDGVGELLVQDETLWWLPDAPPAAAGSTLIDPVELLDGVSAAWFPAAG